jgi:hypothetical protein
MYRDGIYVPGHIPTGRTAEPGMSFMISTEEIKQRKMPYPKTLPDTIETLVRFLGGEIQYVFGAFRWDLLAHDLA